MSPRSAGRDKLSRRDRGSFYDPEAERYGIPTYPWRWAPQGLLTRRQLRAAGLSPGGQDVQAQILWRHRRTRRVAYLYEASQAAPKRTPTAAQLEAIGKALTARKTCPTCQQVKDYCIPRSLGECAPCHDSAHTAASDDRAAGRSAASGANG